MILVRKSLLLVIMALLVLVCACAAAETEYDLGAVSGKMSVDEETYIVLTPANLSDHPDLLAEIGRTADDLQVDWLARGVLLQAWTKDKKTSVEVSVFRDEESARYYDLETQSNATRKQYYKDLQAALKQQGYNISDPELKLHAKSGHYVVVTYSRKDGEATRRGILRRTIRNGYVLQVDYEVFGRKPTKSDKDKGRKIINSISIEQVAPVNTPAASADTQSGSGAQEPAAAVPPPAGAAGTLNVTVPPPAETNDGVFTIEGTAYPGSKLIIVAMRWSGTAYRFYADATKAGKFKAKITLPDEGLYQFTINMDINDQPVADAILNAVTYSKSMLPVTMDAEIPEEISSDELVISGVTVKNVQIQCIVSNGTTTYDKTVKTNGTGKFKFKVPTSAEGDYDITLAFSKKNLNSKRLTFRTSRTLTAQDTQARSASKAVHPAYSLLTRNLDSYIGKTVVYTVYITDIQQTDDEWIVTAALKASKGSYSNFLVFMAKEDPGLTVGSKVKIYGTCIGAYQVQSEEGDTSYPGFDYLYTE